MDFGCVWSANVVHVHELAAIRAVSRTWIYGEPVDLDNNDLPPRLVER